MRWRQKYDPVTDTSSFVPVDEAARASSGHFVQGDIESFVSPIDGSVISDRAQLRAHNARHKVVNSAEFSPEWLTKKAKERQDFFEGKHSKEETLARKQELHEKIVRAERGLPY